MGRGTSWTAPLFTLGRVSLAQGLKSRATILCSVKSGAVQLGNLARRAGDCQATAIRRSLTEIERTTAMTITESELIRRLLDSRIKLVMAVTGGGAGAISSLVGTPGASRVVLEAIVPYSSESLARWLGAHPEKYCDSRVARSMAMAAFQRARELAPMEDADAYVGLACTASLASDRPKRGVHRAHLALQTAGRTTTHDIEWTKGARDRAAEERQTARAILNLLGDAAGLAESITLDLLPGEHVARREVFASEETRRLILGQADIVGRNTKSLPSSPSTCSPSTVVGATPRLIFPGAFDPRHQGHRRMAEIAAKHLGARFGAPVEHELSIVNVDKPPLDYQEIESRAGQFEPDSPLWLTRAATFEEKARLFPGATFVVGADTLARIADARYYPSSPRGALDSIERVAALGCRFLVFGRKAHGEFRDLAALGLPEELRRLCEEIPREEFQDDISSTEIRSRRSSEAADS